MHIQIALFDLEAGLIKRRLNSRLLHAQLRSEPYQGKKGGWGCPKARILCLNSTFSPKVGEPL